MRRNLAGLSKVTLHFVWAVRKPLKKKRRAFKDSLTVPAIKFAYTVDVVITQIIVLHRVYTT